jgi:hypothetical protein
MRSIASHFFKNDGSGMKIFNPCNRSMLDYQALKNLASFLLLRFA